MFYRFGDVAARTGGLVVAPIDRSGRRRFGRSRCDAGDRISGRRRAQIDQGRPLYHPARKPGGSVSYGGLFAFTVDRAAIYRIALGSGAWIDVLKEKAAVVSIAHGHGPDCSGVRKLVDFPLTPGRYILQIAANGEPTLPLMIARLP